MCTFFCFFYSQKKKQKKVPKKKKKKRTVFYVFTEALPPFSRVFYLASPNLFMFAIVLRTRSQLAPTLTLPHWGGKNMPSTV